MTNEYSMTAEIVSEGHPDKLADQISDAVLDAYLAVDPESRVACETVLSGRTIMIAGEVASREKPSISKRRIVEDVLADVGYDQRSLGFRIGDIELIDRLQAQSGEIAAAVVLSDGQVGAGDQGVMFGYATDETPEMMPMPVVVARRLMIRHAEMRHSGRMPWLRPDAKCQVTWLYRDGQPIRPQTIVLSTQHSPDINLIDLRKTISEQLILPALPEYCDTEEVNLLINPAGTWHDGGPIADTGLTGRKIAVDSYGPFCPVGGGAFSGKDPSKVDRSAAYAARYIAKNVVAAGLARRCQVQLAYAIGSVAPVAVTVDTLGTGECDASRLTASVCRAVDLSPTAIIRRFNLRGPVYRNTARFGHFGDPIGRTWEQIDIGGLIRECL